MSVDTSARPSHETLSTMSAQMPVVAMTDGRASPGLDGELPHDAAPTRPAPKVRGHGGRSTDEDRGRQAPRHATDNHSE